MRCNASLKTPSIRAAKYVVKKKALHRITDESAFALSKAASPPALLLTQWLCQIVYAKKSPQFLIIVFCQGWAACPRVILCSNLRHRA